MIFYLWKEFCRFYQSLSRFADILLHAKTKIYNVWTLSDWFIGHAILKHGNLKQLRFERQATTAQPMEKLLPEDLGSGSGSCLQLSTSGPSISSVLLSKVETPRAEIDLIPRTAAVEKVLKFVYDHDEDCWRSFEQHVLFASRPLTRDKRYESYMTWEVNHDFTLDDSIFISKWPIPRASKSGAGIRLREHVTPARGGT
ncbi:hypothetical protein GUITHDRAFT_111718 [Guillardia theta CCMP2712]|uniref:Uncharacterized protein n=1 Tax=Guillardia theta (strain CCMP2712) TaxID=905079 RepID=L1J0V7_GUITC|nr:hypothetical protein GUITHDRAFT_111718 [Guillardia theta CCMP2712]EKX42151.1 hypothetical protein GUITHDRAFT_111718 [Guillardia theta CCMP2712]|eukprot:XP_005829131.1 hypothetical protein GUITHDRAFT_111718 [Guillardia theta CCMP2712]